MGGVGVAVGEETMTLVEAARISGYTADSLGSLVRKGKLPNCGRKGDSQESQHRDMPEKIVVREALTPPAA